MARTRKSLKPVARPRGIHATISGLEHEAAICCSCLAQLGKDRHGDQEAFLRMAKAIGAKWRVAVGRRGGRLCG